jgi:hypothetical protein
MLAAFVLLSCAAMNAQEKSAPPKEIALQLFVRGHFVDYVIYGMPGAGLRYGKHAVSGGPLIERETRPVLKVKGIFLGYNYYPAWQFRRLSGHAVLQYQHAKYYSRYEYTLTAGYGLDFRLFDNLYLDQSFTVGAAGWFATRELDPYYHGYPNLDLVTTLQFGLRYDFVCVSR